MNPFVFKFVLPRGRPWVGAVVTASTLLFVLTLSGWIVSDRKTNDLLPRFAQLAPFDPYRAEFECRHEADVSPRPTAEAEWLYQEALLLDRPTLRPQPDRIARAAALYGRAMALGHWKAQFNLAGMYLEGWGVEQDLDRAIEMIEDLMLKGVPAAWDNMGSYYMAGVGPLKQDATVAYAFWQRAAEMGSVRAQAYLGERLDADINHPPTFWNNRRIGRKLLECAYAQGSREAAAKLAVSWEIVDRDYGRALMAYHQGARIGSRNASGGAASAFGLGDEVASGQKDPSRDDRYGALNDAIYRNSDLRFPNLDRVVPLPPAELPKWDGDPKALVAAALPVVPLLPVPERVPDPAWQRIGRAHVPEGQVLPDPPPTHVAAQYETVSAPVTGYWIARLMKVSDERQARWNAEQVPLRYAKGELFDRSRPGLRPEDGRIQFHYLGEPVPMPLPVAPVDPRVARGVARAVVPPHPPLMSRGDVPAPRAGIWQGRVVEDHPKAAVYNEWWRQAYVEAGAPFPDPRDIYLPIDPADVSWQWWGEANRVEGGVSHLPAGKPQADGKADRP